VAAQGKNAAARTSDISEQQLKNRSRANDLHAFGVPRPADRIANRRGLFGARSRRKNVRHFQEQVFGNPAVALHHFQRIARKMAFQHLKDAARMLKCRVRFKLAGILRFATAIFAMSAASFGVPRRLL